MREEYIVIAFLLKYPKIISNLSNKLKPEYLGNKVLRAFYKMILKAKSNGNITVTFSVLDQMLRKKKFKKEFYKAFEELMNHENTDSSDFDYALGQVVNSYTKRLLINGVTSISQDLISEDVKNAELQIKKLSEKIDSTKVDNQGLLVDIRKDTDQSITLYNLVCESLKKDNESLHIKTGINYLDAKTGGGKRGSFGFGEAIQEKVKLIL